MLAYAWGDPWKFAAETVGDELRLLLVTLGARGAAYVASSSFRADPGLWQERGPRGALTTPTIVRPAAVTSERVAAATSTVDGDPTGCGDVWGATCFCALLAGESLRAAVEAANTAASRNLAHRGAGGLHHHLSGRLGP
jgi:sugar/nucleoside kinase (ribokinase family)